MRVRVHPMMREAMVAGMLALVGLAFVPQATAIPHPCEDKPLEQTCYGAIDLVGTAIGEACAVGDACESALCFYNTPPRDWQAVCLG